MKRIFNYGKTNHNGRIYNRNSFFKIPKRIPIVKDCDTALLANVPFQKIIGFATTVKKNDGIYAILPDNIKSNVATAGFGNIDENNVIYAFSLTSLFLTEENIAI